MGRPGSVLGLFTHTRGFFQQQFIWTEDFTSYKSKEIRLTRSSYFYYINLEENTRQISKNTDSPIWHTEHKSLSFNPKKKTLGRLVAVSVFRRGSGPALGEVKATHLMEERELVMTVSRFWRASSAFCFTTARLADWPDRNASFSVL